MPQRKSIVAISATRQLRNVMSQWSMSDHDLGWAVGINRPFVSALLLTLTDRVSHGAQDP